MTCNVGGADRGLRIALGVAFVLGALFLNVDTVWRVVLFVMSAIALTTAFIRFCPLNAAIGLNTCRNRSVT
jgi:hypothetical protein